MRIIKLTIVLALLVSYDANSQKAAIQEMNFLIGIWKIEGKENYEGWERKADQLHGESYKIRNEQKYVSEKLEIKLVNNNLIYIATVFNQNQGKGIQFTLNHLEKSLVSFENSNHDFPKKNQYKILNKNTLSVSVLGNKNKGFSYILNRLSD